MKGCFGFGLTTVSVSLSSFEGLMKSMKVHRKSAFGNIQKATSKAMMKTKRANMICFPGLVAKILSTSRMNVFNLRHCTTVKVMASRRSSRLSRMGSCQEKIGMMRSDRNRRAIAVWKRVETILCLALLKKVIA